MKVKGSITIYLSMILISVMLLVNVIGESARISAVQAQIKSYTYMSAESALAGYGRQVYEDYGILLVWEKQTVESVIKKNIQDNINMADLNEPGLNFLGTNLVNLEVTGKEYLTKKGGQYFSNQIKSYIKYAGVMETVERLVKECETYENCNDQNKNKCDLNIVVDVNKGELQELVENINSIVTGLKETKDLSNKYDSVSQKIEKLQSDFNKKEGKKVLKEYRELMASIEIKSKDVDSAISKIEVYERKKEQFLKKNSYTSDAKDYMDTNLEILEKVRDEIKRDKELNVLKIKKLDSGNISKVKKSISNMGKVISEMESLITLESTEEDRDNYSIFENLKDFIDSGVLSQVLENPENVSKNTLSGSNLPSTLKGKKNNTLSKEIKNKCVNALYAGLKFGNYNNPGKNTVLKYELEYIISGKDSDKENLASVVEKIVLAKTGINMAYLITDKEKMEQVSAIAASVAIVTGLPFLEPVAKGVLISAWSMAEAVNDMKILLSGGKVTLTKSKGGWRTSIGNITNGDKKEDSKGLSYKEYCQILIAVQNTGDSLYRIMDLIQINIQKRYNSEFLMSKSLTGFKLKATYETAPLFTAIPIVVNNLTEENNAYKYSMAYYDSYKEISIMTKQLTDENNLKQIRKIEILKKRKRRLEKALIRKYKEQKLANSKLENQRLKSQNSLNFNARKGVACRKTANIIKNETMITRIEKRLSNLKDRK